MSRINEIMDTVNEKEVMTKDTYTEIESKLINYVGEKILNEDVTCSKYGNGRVVDFEGKTLEALVIDIKFENEVKKFSLLHILNNKFVQFVNSEEVKDLWSEAFDSHTTLTKQYLNGTIVLSRQQTDAKKKADAEERAAIKHKRQKDSAIKAFEKQVHNVKNTLSEADEFYYALGWLAKHAGSMTAVLPDYLSPSFEKYFGPETPKTLINTSCKTSGGFTKHWSLEFKCTLKKLKDTVVPASIRSATTDFTKGIHNTAFIWDLVSNYGFQFGKTQDVDKIRRTIPAQFLDSFEMGLIA